MRVSPRTQYRRLKETSTDGRNRRIRRVVPDTFTVLAGSAPGAYPAICAGARGAILAVACVLPELCLKLLALTGEGRNADGLAMQQRLTPLARAVTTGFGIAGLKAAMDLSGYKGGAPRPPLGPLPGDAVDTIRTLLNAARN